MMWDMLFIQRNVCDCKIVRMEREPLLKLQYSQCDAKNHFMLSMIYEKFNHILFIFYLKLKFMNSIDPIHSEHIDAYASSLHLVERFQCLLPSAIMKIKFQRE